MATPIFGRCPACTQALEVTALHCPHCDTSISGRFALSRLYGLAPEQLEFVEAFLRCEGKINRVEEELGISYPTVRSRLNEVLEALGFRTRDESAPAAAERRTVLDRLAAGQITPDQAIDMLQVK